MFKRFLKRPRPDSTLYDTIGRHRIRLPLKSDRLDIKRAFRLYDTALGQIAALTKSRYPGLCAIDIGANVGDTAALIRREFDIPVLCIEGDARLLPILHENIRTLGEGLYVEPSFVGRSGMRIEPSLINDPGRNASLVRAMSPQGATVLRTLDEILADHPSFSHSKLLKTDTEGFDFQIIQDSLLFIRRARPIIFFEYDPSFSQDNPEAGLQTIQLLIGAGYVRFTYYDNFGNYLANVSSESQALFEDLNRYLFSNKRHGTAVYYFDICAFHRDDVGIAEELRSRSHVSERPPGDEAVYAHPVSR
jgi:FkbM family methyltransferase